MDLVNNTAIPANLTVSEMWPEDPRVGVLTAKATFQFDAHGNTALDSQDPVPIFAGDEETELGLLPRDDFPRRDPKFEVIVLGCAHSPNGQPVERMMVRVAVGSKRRSLAVYGDRVWERSSVRTSISTPQPFTRMPLTWERAFGGSCEVFVDKQSPVTIAEPRNRVGRGFNPEPSIDNLAKSIDPPEGYPVYDETRRLPNLEDPRAIIAGWDDNPRPLCWATVPLDSGVHAERCVTLHEEDDAEMPVTVSSDMFHRAHPEWVIDLPPSQALVELTGLLRGIDVKFPLPRLRVIGDFVVGQHTGSRELVPQMLVLLPEERRFYIVYRLLFNFGHEEETERCIRLKTDEGWYQPEAAG
jgi:hypothetical protein